MSNIQINGSKVIVRITVGVSITLGAYLFYQTKEHESRVNDLKDRIESNQTDYDRQINHLKDEYQRQTIKLEDRLEQRESELSKVRDERDRFQADLRGAEEKVRSLENMVNRSPSNVDVRDFEKQLAYAKSELEKFRSLLESAQTRVSELDIELAQVKDELSQVQDDNTRLNAEVAEARNQVVTLQQQLQTERNVHVDDLRALSIAFQTEFEADYIKGGLFSNKKKARREAYTKARQIYEQLNIKYQTDIFSPSIKRLNDKVVAMP